MKISTQWTGGMAFAATDGTNTVAMDAPSPVGAGGALSPKQLCLASIAGCTAMDIVSWLKKHRSPATSLKVECDAPVKSGYPATFEKVAIDFLIDGPVPEALAIEAVTLSQTQYCGVSAMIADSCPITYRVILNGALVAEGAAQF